MDFQNLLKWTDQQVLAKTGKHLDSLQKSILEGVWERQDYEEIADKNERSYDHIKKEAWKLWQLLSDVFQEDIKKTNVRSILENKASSIIYHFVNSPNSNISNNHVNLCRENPQSLENEFNKFSNGQNNDSKFPIIDLKKAPQLRCNYGRTLELSTLKKWIENQTQLITIYGLSGIGKTALTLKLIEEIKTEFDYIIYRSLDNIPQLIDLKDDLKKFFFTSQSNLFSDIIDYLRSYRCLIILDDLENIFKIGELAGQYLTEYKNYGQFFKQIATLSHQSCLILISWELSPDLEILERDHQHTQILSLQGLGEDAKEILRHKDLQNQEMWDQLINLYQGHPSWLNIITSTILELFDGDIALFLEDQENNIYLGDLEPIIESHLQRLSASEKKLIDWLASQNERVNIAQKPTNSELSKSEFLQGIKSLMRRGLVDKVQLENRSYFQVNSLFQSYLKRNLND